MKTVLITGASRGIGAAAAEEFSGNGWHVIINYKNSREKAEKLAKKLGAHSVCADITSSEQVKNMHAELANKGIHIDCIVNNAGISRQQLFSDITEQDWDDVFNMNVKGAFLVTREFLPELIHKKNGSIINISSIWGQTGASTEVHYSASKAAVIGMTKALAKELALSGIRVNCICPGFIDTDMNSAYSEDDIAAITEEIPLMRIGTPKEAAQAISFLASDKASYITGQIIGVNGGWFI